MMLIVSKKVSETFMYMFPLPKNPISMINGSCTIHSTFYFIDKLRIHLIWFFITVFHNISNNFSLQFQKKKYLSLFFLSPLGVHSGYGLCHPHIFCMREINSKKFIFSSLFICRTVVRQDQDYCGPGVCCLMSGLLPYPSTARCPFPILGHQPLLVYFKKSTTGRRNL